MYVRCRILIYVVIYYMQQATPGGVILIIFFRPTFSKLSYQYSRAVHSVSLSYHKRYVDNINRYNTKK